VRESRTGQEAGRGRHVLAEIVGGARRDVDVVTALGQRPRDRQEMPMSAAAVGQPIGQVEDAHGVIIARRPGVLLGPCPAPVPAS
jgi:hypothetical protein